MSRIKGIVSTRRLLRRLPDGVQAELGAVLQAAAPELEGAIRAKTPIGRTGRLAAGITSKFYPKTLRLRVGFLGKAVNRRLFYAKIINDGRRAQIAAATRRSKNGKISRYTVNVRGFQGRQMVTGPQINLRARINRRLQGVWERALQRVAGGSDD